MTELVKTRSKRSHHPEPSPLRHCPEEGGSEAGPASYEFEKNKGADMSRHSSLVDENLVDEREQSFIFSHMRSLELASRAALAAAESRAPGS